MIKKDGHIIAIDSVEHDNTLSGTGRPGDPLGVVHGSSVEAIYFSANSGTNASTEYFKWTGSTLSASSAVNYFNLSFNYAVEPTTGACPDFIYQTQMKVGNTPINDTHYIDGYAKPVNYNVSFNIDNSAHNTYKFTYSADTKVKLDYLHISCIGFINPSGEPVPPVTNIGVLSNEEDKFILFNNDGQNLVLEVD